jgi:hypothetical protein
VCAWLGYGGFAGCVLLLFLNGPVSFMHMKILFIGLDFGCPDICYYVYDNIYIADT